MERKFEPRPRALTSTLRIAPRRHSMPGKYWIASQRVNSPVPASSSSGIHDTVRGMSRIEVLRFRALSSTTVSLFSCAAPSSMSEAPY